MTARAWALICGVGLLLTAAECPPTEEEEKVTFDVYADAFCSAVEKCVATHGKYAPSKEVCLKFYDSSLACGANTVNYGTGLKDTALGFEFDSASAAGCVDWIDGASCDDLYRFEDPACFNVLRATGATRVATGTACDLDANVWCSGDDQCSWTEPATTMCWTCMAPQAAGADCAGGNFCARGFFCNSADDKCTAVKADSQSCGTTNGLPNHYECQSGFCRNGICTAKLARDEACGANDFCQGWLKCTAGKCADGVEEGGNCATSPCANGTLCAGGTCQAYDICQQGGVGAPCIRYYDMCQSGLYCSATDSTCQPTVAVNGVCDDQYLQCGVGNQCDMAANPRTCKPRAANGGTCDADWGCQSFYCNASSQCADRPACTMP